MKKRLHFSFFEKSVFIKSAIIICFLSFFSAKAFSQASVSTDLQDYPPGSTVYITGSGFTPNETVTLQVLHVGGGDDLTSPAHQPWTVTADASGNISSTWYVPADEDEVGATLQLTATGQTSGLVAQTTFTDANSKVSISNVTGNYGGTVTLTAALTQSGAGSPGSNGSPIGGRTITFKFNTTVVGTAVTDGTGLATLSGVYLTNDGTVTGTRIVTGSYNGMVLASFAGDASNTPYSGSSGSAKLTVNQASQTITFNALSAQTFGAGPVTLTATASSGLTVSYSSDNTAVATVSGNILTIVGAGTANITASQAGDANYAAAPNVIQPFTVNKATQTITFNAIGSKVFGTADFSPGATASSGLSVSYSSDNTSVATIVGGNIRIVGVGTANITASQTGNTNYTAAAQVTKSITVTQASQTITFNAIGSKPFGTADFSPGATASSGLAVSYSSDNTNVATIVSGNIHIVGIGTANITASQTGNTNYTAATSVTQSITVTQASQTITFNALNAQTFGAGPVTLTATASSGLTVSYSSDNTAVATVSGNILTIVGAGTANITASQDGNTNYTAAANVTRLFTVNKANQNITFTAPPSQVYGAADFSPGATASSGLAITYTSSNLLVATIVSGNIHIVGVGTSTIRASQPGNSNYNAATTISRTLTVTPAPLTVTATGPSKTYGIALTTVTSTTNFAASAGVNGEAVNSVTLTPDQAGQTAKTAAGTHYIVTPSLATGINGFLASNYQITYIAFTGTVSPALLTITATGGGKVYDGTTTASAITLADDRVSGDVFTDSYTSATFGDKNVGTGKTVTVTGISIAGTDAGNYTFNTTATSTADITPKALTIAAHGVNKVYDGNTDATVTLSDDRVANSGDTFTESYTAPATFADKNVATSIKVSVTGISITGTGTGNYTFNTTASTAADITPAQLTITANAQSKVYGSALTEAIVSTDFTTSPLIGAETIGSVTIDYGSGSSALDAAGTYPGSVTPKSAIGGTFNANNYNINYVAGTLTVTKALLTVTPDPESRYYAYPNPTPMTVSYSGFKNNDGPGSLTMLPTVTTTADVSSAPGIYAITASGAASDNYTFKYVTGYLTVNAVPITFAAIPTQVYGTPNFDPGATSLNNLAAITYTSSNTSVATIVSGKIHIVAIGTTTITADNKSSTKSQVLTVTPALLTITADAKTKTYGDADPALTYKITSGSLVAGDNFTGALTRIAGETVNSYAINQGTLGLSTNYTLTYVGANFVITKKAITVTANAGQTKIYGTTDPVFAYTITTGGSLVAGDSFTGALSRVAGEDVGSYAINQGTLGLSNNYTLTYVGANFVITKKAITVRANAGQTKIYGTADPIFAYSITAGGPLVSGDSFTGALTRVVGEDVGSYAINQGTLGLSNNYTLTYVGDNFVITKKAITVTANAGQTKTYGDADPVFAYSITVGGALVTGDSFTGALARAAGENVGSYAINQGTLALSTNYTLKYVGANFTITQVNSCAAYAYTGTTFANTDPGSTSKTVTLSIVVTASGNEDPASASVKFYNTAAPTISLGTVSPGIVNPNNPKQAIYSLAYPISVGNNPSSTVTIAWTVGENGAGNFSNSGCDAMADVTVSLPTNDFVTGGGFIIPAASSGTHPSDVNTKVNFGFNAKWNKTLSNIQGSGFNAIIRGKDIINNVKVNVLYQIKGTKVTALTVNAAASPYTASFTSNATLIEYNAAGTTVLNSWGSCTLTVAMTDVCEPGAGSNGSSDRIGITLKDNYGNLLYSNNWVSGNTMQQGLNAGNLQIHGDANTPAPPCGGLNTVASLKNDMPQSTKPVISNDLIKDPDLNPLSVTVYPNPSPNYFNISMKGGSNEKVDVFVSDVLGHLLKSYRVTPGSSITLGDNFGVGIYIVQVRQGQTFKYYRIYKAPN